MRFRKGSSHATCSECIKHKSLVQSLGHHLTARKMQQSLLYSHLQAQFADRCEYWRKRGESRCRGLQLVIITDGMDQGKFALPRHAVMKAKTFDSWARPRLHVCATIAHGWAVNFYVSEGDLCKDSNTSLEILSHTITSLKKSEYDLASATVTIQSDNTAREVKNGICMRWASAIVSDCVAKEVILSFLRTGHSHEDVDQAFGQAADWIRRRLPRAECSDDVVRSLNDFLTQMDRPHERQRQCFKLDRTRNWTLFWQVDMKKSLFVGDLCREVSLVQ